MGKVIALTLLGFISFFGSIALGYVYLQNLAAGKDTWYLLILIFLCIGVSAASMLNAGTKNMYAGKPKQSEAIQNDPSITSLGLQNALEKHNEIVSQWRKTNSMKDKMTMIKISTPSQKSQ